MKSTLITLTLMLSFVSAQAQNNPEPSRPTPVWTEADRKYLLDNLTRSRQELTNETKGLTKNQWNFKETPDRWSINQIVEHIDLYELMMMHEISVALQQDSIPTFQYFMPDSVFLDPDPNGLKKNETTDYTKPFTISVPLGNNEGKSNMIWFTTLRGESIDFLKKTNKNIRLHYICFGPNVHQQYMMIFRHTFRHLLQIRRVKQHSGYPK